MTYFVGQEARLATEVRDSGGVLVDATVVLAVTAPDGTVSTPTVEHDETGRYSAAVVLDQPGDWLRVWSVTGPVVSTDADQMHVITPSLRIVGLTDVKEHGNITSSASDRELLDFIGTAQQMIEDRVGAVVPTTVVDERHPAGRVRVYLHRSPVMSVTSVAEYSGATLLGSLSPSDWVVDPQSGALSRLTTAGAYSYFLGTEIRVTYRAGRAPIPEALRWAGKELAIHLWRSSQALRGGRGRGTAGEDVALVGAGYGLPNRVEDAIAPFLRPPVVL